MPKNVRNFWIELTVDGKKTPIATGPRAADGGFELTVYQRNNGYIVNALTVLGRADGNVLCTFADSTEPNGDARMAPIRFETKR